MKEFWQRVDAVGRWIGVKIDHVLSIRILPRRKHRTTADIKQSIYVKKAALIQLSGMAWFVNLINDPSFIDAFSLKQWAVVCGGTGLLMWLATLNARQAFLSNPDQPDKTQNETTNSIGGSNPPSISSSSAV